MPFTPFHWGPVLLIAVIFRKYLDFVSLMIAAVLADIEPLLVISGILDGSLRNFLHTFEGGTVLALGVTLAVGFNQNYRKLFLDQIGFEQKFSWLKVMAGSLIGAYSHVILDAAIYETLNIFYLINTSNLFYGYISTLEMYVFCSLTGMVGVALFFKENNKHPRKLYKELNEYFHRLR